MQRRLVELECGIGEWVAQPRLVLEKLPQANNISVNGALCDMGLRRE